MVSLPISEEKTVSYHAGQVESAGLKPGNGESCYQDVPLVEITATSKPALTVTGGDQRLTFAYQTDMMAGTRHAVPKVEVSQSDIVFAGYGINAPERGWNDYANVHVKIGRAHV